MGARRFEISVGADPIVLELLEADKAVADGKEFEYSARWEGDGGLQLIVNGCVYRIRCETDPKDRKAGRPIVLRVNGRRSEIVIDDEVSKLARSLTGSDRQNDGITTISAPMPGLVSKVEVTKGDHVTRGQGLIILEAMKMENEIRSTIQGEVHEVLVKSGRPVEKGEALLRIGAVSPR